ncbi:hypothetical protein V6N12_076235 [Hibiscus sabdariffa]|uniref:Uncharacterized protein n=1 Tax=Hibiscus sabdariffa TaxID=183260 RepID=A0ABR2B0X5_9ROSI
MDLPRTRTGFLLVLHRLLPRDILGVEGILIIASILISMGTLITEDTLLADRINSCICHNFSPSPTKKSFNFLFKRVIVRCRSCFIYTKVQNFQFSVQAGNREM